MPLTVRRASSIALTTRQCVFRRHGNVTENSTVMMAATRVNQTVSSYDFLSLFLFYQKYSFVNYCKALL